MKVHLDSCRLALGLHASPQPGNLKKSSRVAVVDGSQMLRMGSAWGLFSPVVLGGGGEQGTLWED